jgi:signal transduction histidine kinase
LDDLGLGATVHALCDRAGRYGLEIDCALDLAYEHGRAPSRPTAELESAIYRIGQEALTNARKHGHARRVVVEIAESQTTIELTVGAKAPVLMSGSIGSHRWSGSGVRQS